MPVALKPIRWTLEQAAGEFGIDRDTLAKRLRAASEESGEDRRYATAQIVVAIYGDLDREKTRNEAAKADINEMKRDLDRKRLVPTEAVRQTLEDVRVALGQVIEHSPLDRKSKEAIYANIRDLGKRDFVAPTGGDDPQ
jgi:phage terminase Nu1 subunit (DNA packaging protein)